MRIEIVPELGHHWRGWDLRKNGRREDRGGSYLPEPFHAEVSDVPLRSGSIPLARGLAGRIAEPGHELDGLAIEGWRNDHPLPSPRPPRARIGLSVGTAGDAVQVEVANATVSADYFDE